MLSLILLLAYPFGILEVIKFSAFPAAFPPALRTYYLLSVGGLLGGTVFGSKWLYHAIAKGLWHEDRRTWRFLSPWVSLGTTLGVGALFFAGLFRTMQAESSQLSGSALLGIGFLIGYFSDKALAKMKDVTEVLFGETQNRPTDTSGRDT